VAKHWQTYDHPGDLGLSASADSLGELFEALAEGMAEQISPRRGVRAAGVRPVSVTADSPEDLLVEFLSALGRLFVLEKFLVSRASVTRIDARSLSAELSGEGYDPSRHELGPEIKAVTYHNLRVAQEHGRWVGRVLLDL
jgi:SHS2 domain-containing protein